MLTTTATNLPRLMACNGSRLLPASFPKAVNNVEERNEGDAAHHMARIALQGDLTLEEMVDRKAPNGVYMTDEMYGHVAGYIERIRSRYAITSESEIETSFGNDRWQVNARADEITLDQGNSLYVDDLKYGHGLVEVEENWTLLAHAMGWCISRQIVPARIVLTIHQPRPYHPDGKTREWIISYPQLLEYYAKIDAVLSNPTDILQTGSQCTHCWTLATCPASRAAGMNSIDAAERVRFDDSVSDDLLAFEIDQMSAAQAIIKNRYDALIELAKHRVTNGTRVGNFYIEDNYGHTKWNDGLDGKMLSMLTGKPLEKSGTITPAKARTLGVPEDVIKSLSHRPRIGTKLVRRDISKHASKLLGK